jgi:tetratricopeptide (TPR) repeat protein
VAILEQRRFHPWEGGEGLVSRQWVVAHRELARQALRKGDAETAVEMVEAAMTYPHDLGEGKHLLTPEHELQLLLGQCLIAAGEPDAARTWLERASRPQGDPAAPAGDGPYWRALALRDLGDTAAADALLSGLLADAGEHAREKVRIPYFATSLPTLLLFDDDLNERAHQEAYYLEGLALLGMGRLRAAHARFTALLEARPDHLDAALRIGALEQR